MAFDGIYRGMVMNSADPQMKNRLQVNVPSVAGSANAWAMPCREFNSTAMPSVGTAIWVMFEGGNPSTPVWMGCMN